MKRGKPFTPCCENEAWSSCPGFPNYSVSSCGRLRSPNGDMKQPQERKRDGYCVVLLWDGEKNHGRYMHRLVCEAFAGEPPEGRECAAHGDGVRRNNHASNLRWASYAENEADKAMHGTRRVGSEAHLAKISLETAKQIRRDYADGVKQITLSETYGISQSHVSRIVRNEIRVDA